jgi:hypothetical protein
MDKREAERLLRAEARKLRAVPYPQLAERLAEKQESIEVIAPDGMTYHLEAQGFWDDRGAPTLRVVVSIDDGGLRVLAPLTESFTIAANGAITEISPR